jgi:GTP-binding protein YchF
MALGIGIIGLPNVGKSTLFNALVKEAQAAAENFPFCTIEPNVGIVPIPDDRLQKLADIVKTEKIIPATVRFVDIAGLVAGAHKGEGLGNQFLAHIRETDAIAMVVRCFKNENVLHVSGKVNPKDDIETIRLELILADMQTVEKMITGVERDKKSGNKDAILIHSALIKIQQTLNEEKLAMHTIMTEAEKDAVKHIQLLTQKPILYIGNVSEEDLVKDPSEFGLPKDAILICAKTEAELASLDENEQKEYLASLGLKESGLVRLIHQAYQTLGLEYYFTAGVQEVRAWTIHKGWTAPQAAGVIHTDFEKGFIRAEVMSYHDLVELGTEHKVKEAGKLRVEGKEYVVRDGDILHFRFSS